MNSGATYDNLKNQVLTMFMIKDSKDGGENGGIMTAIYAIIMLSIFQEFFKYLPVLGTFIKENTKNYFASKSITKYVPNALESSRKKSASILFERIYDGTENDIVDALIDFVSNYDGSKYIEYHKIFFVANRDEIFLGNHREKPVYCQVGETTFDQKHTKVEKITMEVYTYELSLTQLREYISGITETFRINKLNKLGDKVYYFDEVIQPVAIDMDGNIQYHNAPKTLVFNMTPFYTNKSLNNMFGPDIRLIMERLRFFLNNRDWYSKKGIPYTFGLLLHGTPGCGKTSLVKAIAGETRRHPFNIKFHDFLTQTQMNSLFFNDRIHINGGNDSYIIPQDKRLYSIEEIDCMSDVVMDRQAKKEDNKNNSKNEDDPFAMLEAEENPKQTGESKNRAKRMMERMNELKSNSEKLTLGFLLNLLDGVLETPGRILIMTTNYPDKLDKALIRPGRVDLIVNFQKTTRDTIIQMYQHFYDLASVDESQFSEIDDYHYSPAEVNQVFFKYIREPKEALRALVNEVDF